MVAAEAVVALAVADLAVAEATLLAAVRLIPEAALREDVAAAAPVRRQLHRKLGWILPILEYWTVLVLSWWHGVKMV